MKYAVKMLCTDGYTFKYTILPVPDCEKDFTLECYVFDSFNAAEVFYNDRIADGGISG